MIGKVVHLNRKEKIMVDQSLKIAAARQMRTILQKAFTKFRRDLSEGFESSDLVDAINAATKTDFPIRAPGSPGKESNASKIDTSNWLPLFPEGQSSVSSIGADLDKQKAELEKLQAEVIPILQKMDEVAAKNDAEFQAQLDKVKPDNPHYETIQPLRKKRKPILVR
jgi:hypothetical protein